MTSEVQRLRLCQIGRTAEHIHPGDGNLQQVPARLEGMPGFQNGRLDLVAVEQDRYAQIDRLVARVFHHTYDLGSRHV